MYITHSSRINLAGCSTCSRGGGLESAAQRAATQSSADAQRPSTPLPGRGDRQSAPPYEASSDAMGHSDSVCRPSLDQLAKEFMAAEGMSEVCVAPHMQDPLPRLQALFPL